MRHRSQFSEKQRRYLSQLISVLRQGPLLKATTYVLRNTCGKPNCRCTSGHKHETLYAARSRQGKRQARSIPRPLREQILRWIERFRQVEELLERLSEESWREFDRSAKKPKRR